MESVTPLDTDSQYDRDQYFLTVMNRKSRQKDVDNHTVLTITCQKHATVTPVCVKRPFCREKAEREKAKEAAKKAGNRQGHHQ